MPHFARFSAGVVAAAGCGPRGLGYLGGKPVTWPRACAIQRFSAWSSSTLLSITTIPRIGPTGHVKGPHARLGGRRVHVLRADPRDKPIVINAGGEVATDHEGQATEHLALTDPGNMLKAGADPVCEQFVKRHALDRRAGQRHPAREGGGQSAGPRTVAALSSRPGAAEMKSLTAARTGSNTRTCHRT
jgi:hypothetical protein